MTSQDPTQFLNQKIAQIFATVDFAVTAGKVNAEGVQLLSRTLAAKVEDYLREGRIDEAEAVLNQFSSLRELASEVPETYVQAELCALVEITEGRLESSLRSRKGNSSQSARAAR
ncbi:hypothetical protein ABLE68_07170 [Nocardioides sp. CN2-186]|uniref:hypothetical protein n=1 Tax=Nocardioides tweenelious TaxID=3156607 RepID=UPI0032B3A41C